MIDSQLPLTDYEKMAPRYDKGRALPLESLDGWRRAIVPYLPATGRRPIIDIGCGTGLWAEAFTQWFGVSIIGIDPSANMLAEAVRKRSHPTTTYLRASGVNIPIKDSLCSCAWLSVVVHHIPDLFQCAGELRRVLCPGGHVLIRNGFSGRTEDISWLKFWPQAKPLADRRWPDLGETVETFKAEGFVFEHIAKVAQQTAPDLQTYALKLETRSDSTLVTLSDVEFEMGLRRLQAAAAAERVPRPVVDSLDLVVLKAP
jgi:SAM-dependent methyltransferase